MEFWVVLAITYGAGMLEDQVSYVPAPSQDECEILMDTVDAILRPQFPDMMLQCIETGEVSHLVHPKPKPEGLK